MFGKQKERCIIGMKGRGLQKGNAWGITPGDEQMNLKSDTVVGCHSYRKPMGWKFANYEHKDEIFFTFAF